MATRLRPQRRKGPARLALAVGSVLATAGFMVAIAAGSTTPAAEAVASAPTTQPTVLPPSPVPGTSAVAGAQQPPRPPAASTAPKPRLRTRGS